MSLRRIAEQNTPPPRPRFYADEIIAVEVPAARSGPVSVAEDEHPRPADRHGRARQLRPLFKDGVTTAGNASGINDGAAR